MGADMLKLPPVSLHCDAIFFLGAACSNFGIYPVIRQAAGARQEQTHACRVLHATVRCIGNIGVSPHEKWGPGYKF